MRRRSPITSSRLYISHWLNTNADWRIMGSWREPLLSAAPLGAAFGGVLLQYLSAPLVIAISGLACILAGLGGLVSPSLRQLQRGSSQFRQGMNTDREIWATWMGSFPSIRVHLRSSLAKNEEFESCRPRHSFQQVA
jgi:uncharacterized membrane protein YfcA